MFRLFWVKVKEYLLTEEAISTVHFLDSLDDIYPRRFFQ
jgi:hypothetical protein